MVSCFFPLPLPLHHYGIKNDKALCKGIILLCRVDSLDIPFLYMWKACLLPLTEPDVRFSRIRLFKQSSVSSSIYSPSNVALLYNSSKCVETYHISLSVSGVACSACGRWSISSISRNSVLHGNSRLLRSSCNVHGLLPPAVPSWQIQALSASCATTLLPPAFWLWAFSCLSALLADTYCLWSWCCKR